MTAAPRLYREDNPLGQRWSGVPAWTAAAVVCLASLLSVGYIEWAVAADSRNAAAECRRATEELRQQRELLVRERELSEAARRDFAAKAMSFVLDVEGKKRGD